jgi:hypothetical protein
VVDDFGTKYIGKHHAEHLINAIGQHYEHSTNWKGALYCGIKIQWDYIQQTVDLSMTGYIKVALHK